MDYKHIKWYGTEVDLTKQGHTGCPRCISKGRDKNKDNLMVYGENSEGYHTGAFCFSCQLSIPDEIYMMENDEDYEEEDILGSEFNSEIHEKLKETTGLKSNGYRGIRDEISKFFGVRYKYDETDGKTVKATLYPTTKDYEIAGYKQRTHPKNFKSPGPIGETGKDCDLFGQFRFKTSSNTLLIVGGECYDDQTEVMTSKGWKFFKDTDENTIFLQVSEGKSSWTKASRLIKKTYNGEMVSFESQQMSLLVTPNHKMVGVRPQNKKDFYFEAGGKYSTANLFRKTTNLQCDGIKSPLSDDQIRFIIALSADAKVDHRSNGRIVAHFSFKKDRKIARLKALLDRLDMHYTEYDKVTHIHWQNNGYHTFNVDLEDWCSIKGLPDNWVNTLSSEQRSVFLEEIVYWDGNQVKNRHSVEFNSKLKNEADLVQSIAVLSGHHAGIRKRKNKYGEWFTVKISPTKKTASFQSVEKTIKQYSGNVFCATVPTGQLLVRRNGKVVVCGNSDQLAAYQMLFDAQKNKNYDPIAVVSGTTGESSVYKQLQNNYDFINQFKKIVICMDADKAGAEATERIHEVLPKGKVFVMKMRYKDPNEYIYNKETGKLVHKEQEFVNDFWAAKPYTPHGVKSAADGLDEIEEELRKPRITLPEYMHEMQVMMGGGMIQGRIANIIADTSSGKSTHVNRMVYHWIFNSPVTPTIVSLEATAAQYMLEMLSIHLEVNLLWKMAPEEIISWMKTEEGQKVYRELAYKEDGQPRFFILDERAGSIKDLEAELEMLYRKHDSKLFVIDVLSDLLRGSSEEHSEDHMNFQRNMAKNGVTTVNVLHTRKPGQSADGKIRKVTEYDALGTGSFVQSAAYNIVLNRDKLSEDPVERNTTEVDLPKCRGGKTGAAGKWYYEFDKSKCHDYNDYFNNPDNFSESGGY